MVMSGSLSRTFQLMTHPALSFTNVYDIEETVELSKADHELPKFVDVTDNSMALVHTR